MGRHKRGFGQVTRLPSKRYRARYMGPDGVRHSAPSTFESKVDAEGWLAAERRLLESDDWSPPKQRRAVAAASTASTLAAYSDRWMRNRDLKPRTREHYQRLLDRLILPRLGDIPLRRITPDMVRDWHADLGTGTPTLRSHAYGLLRTILGTAVADGRIPSNPAHIRGAGSTRRVVKIEPATLDELETIAANMPLKYRPMVMLSSWCGLRFGEVAELRRKDLDLKAGVIHVRRAVARSGGKAVVGTPKSAAGIRDVAIPPHLLPMLREHVRGTIAGGRDGLLFPAADGVSHLAPSTLYRVFYPARKAAGREDLRWHDLRHTGAVLAAQTGATLAELMGRLGHSTPGAAMRYQHAAAGRDAQIAEALSRLAEPPMA